MVLLLLSDAWFQSRNSEFSPAGIIPALQRVAPILARGLVHRQQVLDRHQRLNVMDRVKDEASSGAKGPQALANFPPHFVSRAERKGVLRIDAAAPECDPVPESLLEVEGVHIRRRSLHGVEDVKPRGDEVLDQCPHGTATVDERLPGRMLMDPVVDQLVEG